MSFVISSNALQPAMTVVNLLSWWSNDALRSTLHRVVPRPEKQINEIETMTPAWQSIAFFCNPNFGTDIVCLPDCGHKVKHPSIRLYYRTMATTHT